MAHGKTLEMRAIKRPAPTYLMIHIAEVKTTKTPGLVLVRRMAGFTPYTNPERDRSLPGKARRQARKAARR